MGRFLNLDGARPVFFAALMALLLLPCLGGTGLRDALRYERTGIAAGQIWRLLTAHFVHIDLRHALLNALGAALMWVLFLREYTARQWFVILAAGVVAIDAGLWLRDPQVEWYVGASGVLHAVMAAGTLAQLRRRESQAAFLMLLLIVKLVYEETQHALPFAGDIPVVTQAHLYGTAGGLLVAFLMVRFAARTSPRTPPL